MPRYRSPVRTWFPAPNTKNPCSVRGFLFLVLGSSQRASHRWIPAPKPLNPCNVRGFLFVAHPFSANVAPLLSPGKTIKPLQRQGFNARGTASSQRMSHHCFAAPMTRTLASRDFALGNRYICSRRNGSASVTSRPLLASCKGHAQKAMPLRVEILERLRDRSALAASRRRQTTNPSLSPRQ